METGDPLTRDRSMLSEFRKNKTAADLIGPRRLGFN
jgi:hypothetical protein